MKTPYIRESKRVNIVEEVFLRSNNFVVLAIGDDGLLKEEMGFF